MKDDGPQFLVEQSHPLFSSLHLAASETIRFFCASSREVLQHHGSAQFIEHLLRSLMLEAVDMFGEAFSLDGVAPGIPTTPEWV
ncbi:hypothetical protein KR52_11520 [Synechococcus sp. KORDI-52]|nr:hypothetical protein KR52_11520 [Synechococcus sp. KORDI-52]